MLVKILRNLGSNLAELPDLKTAAAEGLKALGDVDVPAGATAAIALTQFQEGQVRQLPDAFAQALIAHGLAEETTDPPTPEAELKAAARFGPRPAASPAKAAEADAATEKGEKQQDDG